MEESTVPHVLALHIVSCHVHAHVPKSKLSTRVLALWCKERSDKGVSMNSGRNNE
jgi:hypothetical protein